MVLVLNWRHVITWPMGLWDDVELLVSLRPCPINLATLATSPTPCQFSLLHSDLILFRAIHACSQRYRLKGGIPTTTSSALVGVNVRQPVMAVRDLLCMLSNYFSSGVYHVRPHDCCITDARSNDRSMHPKHIVISSLSRYMSYGADIHNA